MKNLLTIKQKNKWNTLGIELFFVSYFVARIFCKAVSSYSGTALAGFMAFLSNFRIGFLLMFIALVALGVLWFKKSLTTENSIVLFLLRIPLYAIPLLYIRGDFQWGLAYAIIQIPIVYSIGYSYRGNISTILKIVLGVSIALMIEVWWLIISTGTSIFDSAVVKHVVKTFFGHANTTASFLTLFCIVCNEYFKDKNKIALIAYNVAIALTVILTASRFSLLVIIFYYGYHFVKLVLKYKKSKILWGVIGGIALIGLIVVIWKWSTFWAVLQKFTFQSLTENRFRVYKDVLALFIRHPIFGRSAFAYQAFDVKQAHNLILESLVQTGIVGTALYGLILFIVIKRFLAIKDTRLKRFFLLFIGVLLVQCMIEPNLFALEQDTLIWFIIGIGAGVYGRERETARLALVAEVEETKRFAGTQVSAETTETKKKLSVIIVSYINMDILRDCLNSIAKYNDIGDALEVIVSDNSPNDELYNTVRAEYPWVKTIKNENKGYGAGNNRGYEISTGEYLLLLNPDTILVEPIFQFALDAFEKDAKLGLFGLQLLKADCTENASFYPLDRYGILPTFDVKLRRIWGGYKDGKFFVCGACMFVRRETFELAGKFDENIFMYKEEADLIKRVKLYTQTPKTAFFRDRKVIHLEGGTEEKDENSAVKFVIRNAETARYYAEKWRLPFKKMFLRLARYSKFKYFLYRITFQKRRAEIEKKVIQTYEEEANK